MLSELVPLKLSASQCWMRANKLYGPIKKAASSVADWLKDNEYTSGLVVVR